MGPHLSSSFLRSSRPAAKADRVSHRGQARPFYSFACTKFVASRCALIGRSSLAAS